MSQAQPRPIVRTAQAQRDSRGRPVYLAKLPLWKRYPRIFILGGGLLVGFLPWGYQVYQILFATPENTPYEATLWPSEKISGKTLVQQLKERQAKEEEYRKLYELRQAELLARSKAIEEAQLREKARKEQQKQQQQQR